MKKILVKHNYYKDSITLMSITNTIKSLDNIINVSVSMGTSMNKEILKNIGFIDSQIDDATDKDMIIALEAKDNNIDSLLEIIDNEMNKKQSKNSSQDVYDNTLYAINDNDDLNLAIISIPGSYAYREVKTCLDNNINVMLFSDNMSIEEEKKLKEYASSKDLLMMGPDCGTAIINGNGICFANKVRKGNIGIVGASGTGIQEVTVLIHALGHGISNAIGTGGRDLSEDIGGIMMIKGIDFLEKDDKTDMIVIISKPPAESVAKKIIDRMSKINKKKLICFIDGDREKFKDINMAFENTLEGTALNAVKIMDSSIKYEKLESDLYVDETSKAIIKDLSLQSKNGKYLRGLYCGGTLAAESYMLIKNEYKTYSNVTKNKEYLLKEPFDSIENTIIDLGDDYFTRGKAHPMIDPAIRNERIIKEASDKDVALLVLDFELGYGSNKDPVGVALSSITQAQKIAKKDGRQLAIIAYVLGTDLDTQNKLEQENKLKSLGVYLSYSNAQSIRIAKKVLNHIWSK